jgi:hypothetical protein
MWGRRIRYTIQLLLVQLLGVSENVRRPETLLITVPYIVVERHFPF